MSSEDLGIYIPSQGTDFYVLFPIEGGLWTNRFFLEVAFFRCSIGLGASVLIESIHPGMPYYKVGPLPVINGVITPISRGP